MPGARLTKRNLRNEGKIWYNPADQTRSCKTTPFCRYADNRAINISDSFYGQNFMVNILIHSLYGIRHVNSTPNLLTAITLHDDQKSGQNLSALSSFNGNRTNCRAYIRNMDRFWISSIITIPIRFFLL
jgi:hypothetical protein